MHSFPTFRRVALLMLLAAVAAPACSDKNGPMLLVDVSLGTNVRPPTTVQFLVYQGTSTSLLSEKNLTWPGGTTADVGLTLPEGSAGDVTVTANGIVSGRVVSTASGAGKIGGSPIALVLASLSPPGVDAGPYTSEAGNLPVDSSVPDEVGTGTGRDSAPAVDLDKPDNAGLDADAAAAIDHSDGPVEVGLPDAPDGPSDAGIPDSPSDTAVDSTGKLDSAVATRSWSKPLNLSAPVSAGEPSVAVHSKSGDAVVAWAGTISGVTAVHYVAATDTWGKPVTVTDDVYMSFAEVAVDASGRYLLVWSRIGDGKDATATGVWISFSSDGVAWSKPTRIFAGGGAYNYDSATEVVMNRAGQAVVVWDHEEQAGWNDHSLYVVYVEGTAFQPAKKLASCGSSKCGARAAIDGSGNGLVVWGAVDPVYDTASVWGATFAKQTMGTPELLESLDTAEAGNATVAMNALGQGMVVWQQASNSVATDIYARRYSVANGWDASPERAARGSAGPSMTLALDSVGTAELAWSNSTSLGYQVTVSSQAYNSSWETQAIETDDHATTMYYGYEPEPQLVLDGSNNLLVGWRKAIVITEFAPHFRWRNGNTWGTDTEIGAIPDLSTDHMRLGAADNGSAVATWTHYRCDPYGRVSDAFICPDGKRWEELSPEAQTAFGAVFVSVYR